MKKKKVFIFLSAAILILFFAVAATCNFCGVPVNIGETDETEEEDDTDSGERSTSPTTAAAEGGADTTDADEPPEDEPPADVPPEDEPPEDEPPADEPPEEPIGEGGSDVAVFTLPVDLNLSGYVAEDDTVVTRSVWIGDDVSNNAVKGYISFEMSDLLDGPVIDASLSITGITSGGDPTFADRLVIKVYDYGDTLTASAFREGGEHLAYVSTAGMTSINVSGDSLKNLVETKNNAGNMYFQLKLGLEEYSDNDGTPDLFLIDPGNAVLRVTQ